MSEKGPTVHEIRNDEFRLRSQAPGPALAGLVTRITSYRERVSCGQFQRETVSLTVPLIIGFADPFAMAHGREPGDNERFVSFVGGLCTKPVIIRSEGDVHCLQIDFTPLGARLFFGMPMDALAERIVAVDDLADRGVSELRSRLGDVDDWETRHRLAEDFVAARIAGSSALSRPVALAYGAIVETGGRVTISALASRLDWSRKHLAQTFSREVGLTPKSVARIVRFGRAHAMAEAKADWAGIAAECGYSDQAHLVREFVAFSGLTPTALAAG